MWNQNIISKQIKINENGNRAILPPLYIGFRILKCGRTHLTIIYMSQGPVTSFWRGKALYIKKLDDADKIKPQKEKRARLPDKRKT